MPGNEYEKAIIREGQREAIITRRGRIMKELEAGHQATISDVEGMAHRHEGFFPAGTEQHLRQALPRTSKLRSDNRSTRKRIASGLTRSMPSERRHAKRVWPLRRNSTRP